ncbi:ABC transporter substrate-binding protein (plasmid) [Pantoea piersonii]|uniref:ABC transporter substrate-binding protein n=1 Tax=Pantoea piersonii TaxID=2364647 RepID=A0AAJ5UCE2_9GAMM|nr:ABC transporter substrate-binding protein [Pantoea piersonii]WBG93353.1 ABC transporter substrate-binding protein [Pantoea piersonii]
MNLLAKLLCFTLFLPLTLYADDFKRVDIVKNEQPLSAPINPNAVAKIPADFHFITPGYLTIAISTTHSPPLYFLGSDNKSLIGSDPDIASLIAQSLGLKLRIIPAAWEDWPLGITSGRYDAAMFNIAVTEERKKKFDFATYRSSRQSFSARADSSLTSINSPEEAAGKRIIVQSGTNQERILLSWDEKNRAKGLKPVDFIYLSDEASSMLYLLSGRADAMFGPDSSASWKVALNGKTKIIGYGPYRTPVAVTSKKGNGLDIALQEAINGLIQNGKYREALKRWGQSSEAVSASEVNPPGIIYQ